MEGPIFAVAFFASVILLVATVSTWVVVHQAATEAREYYRRQNAAARKTKAPAP